MIESFKDNFQEGKKAENFAANHDKSDAKRQEAVKVATYYYAKAIHGFWRSLSMIERQSVMSETLQAVGFLKTLSESFPSQSIEIRMLTLIDIALIEWNAFETVIGHNAITHPALFAQKIHALAEAERLAHAHLSPVVKAYDQETEILPPAATLATPRKTKGDAAAPKIEEPALETNDTPIRLPEIQLTSVNPKKPGTLSKTSTNSPLPKKTSFFSWQLPPMTEANKPIKSHQAIISEPVDTIIATNPLLLKAWHDNNL